MSLWPHSPQNFAPGTTLVPHSVQNLAGVAALAGAAAVTVDLGAVRGDDVAGRGDDDDTGEREDAEFTGREDADVPYAGAREPWFLEPS